MLFFIAKGSAPANIINYLFKHLAGLHWHIIAG